MAGRAAREFNRREALLAVATIGSAIGCGAAAALGSNTPAETLVGLSIAGVAVGGVLCWPVSSMLRRKARPGRNAAVLFGLPFLVSAATGLVGHWLIAFVIGLASLVGASLVLAILLARDPLFVTLGMCRGCGYFLRGLRGRVCPECGAPVDEEQVGWLASRR